MKLSERIKKYRQENNLTQEQFASMLFVSKQAISKWENDRGMPDVSLLPELAKILNISIDEIMGVSPKREVLEEEVKNKKNKFSYKIIIPISAVLLIIIIAVIIISATKAVRLEKSLKNQTEEYINLALPNIEKYDYADLSSMPADKNYQPIDIYYFIFEEGKELEELEKSISNNGNWSKKFSDAIYNELPYYLQAYSKNSDLFLIIKSDDKTIIFIAYQEAINRLIVSEYEIG